MRNRKYFFVTLKTKTKVLVGRVIAENEHFTEIALRIIRKLENFESN